MKHLCNGLTAIMYKIERVLPRPAEESRGFICGCICCCI